MNRLLKKMTALMLIMAVVCMIGCKKADEPNNGDNNENNGGNGGETPEAPAIVSTSEVQYDGKVYIEALFKDDTKMYFEIVSPNEMALVSGKFFYQDNPSLAYIYRGNIVIPESIKHFGISYSVVSIAKEAFYRNELVTSVYIPNSVTSIKMYPKGMFHGAFQGCINLSIIHMSENIQDIGSNSFVDCPCYQQTVTIPKQVKNIGANAFYSENVVFNADSCVIAGGETVEINSPYPHYYSSAFPKMNFISFGNNVKVLPAYLYAMTDFTTIDIPSINTIIPDYAFCRCTYLSKANIPNTVTTIGNSAFRDCASLTEISLPNSISHINDYAYYNTDNTYTNITCMAINPPVLGNNVFGQRRIEVIFVNLASVEAYKTADGWSQYSDVIVGI